MKNTLKKANETMTKYRWTVCTLLFFATTINYMDRQIIALLKTDLAHEFHWTESDFGWITGVFSLVYAVSMFFVGGFVDKVGTKKGYIWAITIWSSGACIHAVCGIFTEWYTGIENAEGLINASGEIVKTISLVSLIAFIFARIILAVGEAGNFPSAVKATAEYFPKKDRAFATGIFNSGSNVGAILAPLTVPFIASKWGWEMAFLIVGAIGFIWLAFWLYLYKSPENNTKMNDAERAYINQDNEDTQDNTNKESVSILYCLKYKQSWSVFLGKFITDGVWWFFLFWTPAYLYAEYGLEGTDIALPLGVLYTITVFGSVFGGKFPTYFINKGMEPYDGRMKAMFFIALVPLVVLLAQPLAHIEALGNHGYWIPVILIGIGCAGHQAWSANIYTAGSDMFPKKAVARITGFTGLAGGLSSFLLMTVSGYLFDYAKDNFEGGISTGYSIIFGYCAVAYIIGWTVMKTLVPRFKKLPDL
ncbi:MFS transporter [Dysgonomonas sp. Marseille-P4361]|uniref:MFS transporter n=1 Tax=Dysgonomonas sp. Marseille-P4361 TaxID=2161820 RepID=UPI000D554E78|nr:MFS transporter [Dysgonomonas sp. Marseille-P4361]